MAQALGQFNAWSLVRMEVHGSKRTSLSEKGSDCPLSSLLFCLPVNTAWAPEEARVLGELLILAALKPALFLF